MANLDPAITNTVTRKVKNVIGDRAVTHGTLYNPAGTAGSATIDVNLKVCEFLQIQGTASVTGTATWAVRSIFPVAGSAVIIATNATSRGAYWMAYGY